MKFSDYFFAPGKRLLSVIFGGICGLLVWGFAGWQYAVLVGATVALLTSFILPVRVYLAEKPYAQAKSTLPTPFIFDQRVRFTVSGGAVGGYMVLTDNLIVLLSMERGEHRLELKKSDVKSIVLGENMTISVYLSNTEFINVISEVAEEMFDILRENGWVCPHQ